MPLDALEAVILAGADWDKVKEQLTKIDNLQKAFMVAAHLDSPCLAQLLLSLNVEPAVSHLQKAIKSGSDEIAVLLINQGMGIKDKINSGNEWLLSAVIHGRTKVVSE